MKTSIIITGILTVSTVSHMINFDLTFLLLNAFCLATYINIVSEEA